MISLTTSLLIASYVIQLLLLLLLDLKVIIKKLIKIKPFREYIIKYFKDKISIDEKLSLIAMLIFLFIPFFNIIFTIILLIDGKLINFKNLNELDENVKNIYEVEKILNPNRYVFYINKIHFLLDDIDGKYYILNRIELNYKKAEELEMKDIFDTMMEYIIVTLNDKELTLDAKYQIINKVITEYDNTLRQIIKYKKRIEKEKTDKQIIKVTNESINEISKELNKIKECIIKKSQISR